MRNICAAILLILAVDLSGQVSERTYRFGQEIPPAYQVDPLADYHQLRNEKFKGARQRDVSRFAELTAYSKSNLFQSGKVYFDPPVGEAYLNELVSLLVPQKASEVNVYLARDAAYNAYAIHDGSLFVNVGLLAEMKSEAALAAVLGHEVSHWTQDDIRVSFFNKLKLYNRRNRNYNYELRIDKAHDDRQMEHIADSLSVLLCRAAGYKADEARHNFLLFIDENTETDNYSSDSVRQDGLQNLLASHPDTRSRLEFIEDWSLKDSTLTSGANYLLGNTRFIEVRSMARMESLQLLLEGHDYNACLERAFRYHLFEPASKVYVYFIIESLRRLLYVIPDYGNDGFLRNNYHDYLAQTESILSDLPLLLRDTSLSASVHATEYLDRIDPPFTSYEEALVYFLNKGEELNMPEAMLAKALYYRNDNSLRDSSLVDYIRHGGQYMEFALSMMNGRLDRDLKKLKRELLLVDDIDIIEDHTYGFHTRYLKREERGPQMLGHLESMISREFPSKDITNVNLLRRNDLGKYLSYSGVYANMQVVEWMWDYEEHWEKTKKRRKELARRESKLTSDSLRAAYERGKTRILRSDDEIEIGVDLDSLDLLRRKRSVKRDMKFYYIDPGYWEFLRNGEYGTVEYVKITSFDDKTKLLGNILQVPLIVYPFWYGNRLANGSNRYAFNVMVARFNSRTHNVESLNSWTSYRMSKFNLRSVVYRGLLTLNRR